MKRWKWKGFQFRPSENVQSQFALSYLLIIAAVMTCLFTGVLNPVVAVFAMLMPAWVVAALCLWCTVL